MTPEAIGRYRITGILGQGGMGIVYAARDDRLERSIALKVLRGAGSPEGRERLLREARAAAAVNHPAICQLYEIGEADGELFLAMELLEGESLAARLARGRLPVPEVVPLALGILAGLGALHRQGFVHRDLKPSNVFLTPYGVKLLDFGLARPAHPDADRTTSITASGLVMATPQYASPEQLRGEPLDGRSDIFTAGAVVYEMLAGTPPFSGSNPMQLFHAIVYEAPPALIGAPLVAALDRVIQRAMAKQPADRYPTAEAFGEDLRAALLLADTSGPPPRARTVTRLLVLPLRLLRPDPETDFLAFSLPDAITSSLSGLESLVVRSSLAASQFAGQPLDLPAVAAKTDVDLVLAGTLLRAADRVRVASQLLQVPDGTVLWSHTVQAPVGDLFQLQDELSARIVESLALPLTSREKTLLRRDVPASPAAYEHYLRANELARGTGQVERARDLYMRAVEEDPHYAPAWARLGRMFRLQAKYVDGTPGPSFARAEAAFRRALELNPDLSLAENLYAQLEVDLGRAREAMVRLLGSARDRTADPELFAGLGHACRYCGLLRASLAAFERARRLDPAVALSVSQTFFMLGEYEKVVEADVEPIPYIRNLALVMLGREREALESLRRVDETSANRMALFTRSLRLLLEDDRAGSAATAEGLATLADPEARFYVARHFARLEQHEPALALLEGLVAAGFFCYPALARDPWLDSLRLQPRFAAVLQAAEDRHREARIAFLQAGGDRILGVPGP